VPFTLVLIPNLFLAKTLVAEDQSCSVKPVGNARRGCRGELWFDYGRSRGHQSGLGGEVGENNGKVSTLAGEPKIYPSGGAVKYILKSWTGFEDRLLIFYSSKLLNAAWWAEIWNLNRTKKLRCHVSVAMYLIWNLWKERNRSVFESKSATANVVASLGLEECKFFFLANKV
jgi:hypothetical protein